MVVFDDRLTASPQTVDGVPSPAVHSVSSGTMPEILSQVRSSGNWMTLVLPIGNGGNFRLTGLMIWPPVSNSDMV